MVKEDAITAPTKETRRLSVAIEALARAINRLVESYEDDEEMAEPVTDLSGKKIHDA